MTFSVKLAYHKWMSNFAQLQQAVSTELLLLGDKYKTAAKMVVYTENEYNLISFLIGNVFEREYAPKWVATVKAKHLL